METLQGHTQEQRPAGTGSNANVSESERERLHSKVEEKEKSEKAREHHEALANAADHVWTAKQRVDELENLRGASPSHTAVPKPGWGSQQISKAEAGCLELPAKFLALDDR
ncbi:hypothetical protein H2202_010781 [Exophiala xenobiotica]|nr:hypothetical protein H2202_010781 [Exophiala xenobiotica]